MLKDLYGGEGGPQRCTPRIHRPAFKNNSAGIFWGNKPHFYDEFFVNPPIDPPFWDGVLFVNARHIWLVRRFHHRRK